MNKQELLENYTMEQLADKVIALEITISDMKNTENIIKKYNSKQCDCGKENEINQLKDQLQRKETTINQIDDILNELFGATHDIVDKPDEFKEILKERIKNSKTLVDFLPAEPINVADMLINTEIEPKSIENGAELVFYKRKFSISELRQIAEHLLVYCDANESEEI